MLPIIALSLAFAAAILVALADRPGITRFLLRTRPTIAFLLCVVMLTGAAVYPMLGCASSPEARARQQHSLAAVVSRVDVARIIECSKHGLTTATARCLGARVLTEGLEEALHQANTLAENALDAGNPQAGAADMDAEQDAALAAELDAALDNLAIEIAVANTLDETR